MSIAAACPHCRAPYVLADQLFGKKIRCGRCQANFVVGAIPQAKTEPMVAARRPSQLRPPPVPTPVARPVAAPVTRPIRSEHQPTGVWSMVLGGSIVAAVFALVLVGGIALIFHLRTPSQAQPAPSAPQVAENRPTVREPAAEPPTTAKAAPKEETPPAVPKEFPKEAPKEPQPPPVAGDGSLAPQVLQRVKKATVYLRVTLQSNSVAQGSGFFAVEPGIIVTNAHVLGMLVGQTRRPQKVDVVLNSGQTDERVLPGQILEVDRVSDLAVLRVAGANLPEPLSVHSAKDLQETQQVYVCGFPLGVNLGREISVRKSSVASLRRDAGELVRVQLEGSMDPGNSGGPIIDTRGNVVGVAVAGIQGRTINFAIPGDRVQSLLNGRVSKVTFGQPYKDGDKARLPVTVQLLDPLGKIRQAGIDLWTGEPGQDRPASRTPPAALPKDSPRRQLLQPPRDGVVGGELELPSLPAGQVYWFQPVVVLNGAKEPHWEMARVYPNTAPPLERRSVTLALNLRAGTHVPLEMSCTTSLRMDRAGEERNLVIDLDGQLRETTQVVDNQGTATIRLEYLKMTVDVTVDGKPQGTPNRMQQALPFLNQMVGDLRIDRQGNLVQNRLDLSKVQIGARQGLTEVGEQMQRAIDAVTPPLPAGAVKPGQSWTAARVLPFDTTGRYDLGTIDWKYTYLGVRSRNGRDEAVLTLDGTVQPRQGSTSYLKGRTTGTVVVDIPTGLLTMALADVEVDMDFTLGKDPVRADGTMQIKLLRTLPAP